MGEELLGLCDAHSVIAISWGFRGSMVILSDIINAFVAIRFVPVGKFLAN